MDFARKPNQIRFLLNNLLFEDSTFGPLKKLKLRVNPATAHNQQIKTMYVDQHLNSKTIAYKLSKEHNTNVQPHHVSRELSNLGIKRPKAGKILSSLSNDTRDKLYDRYKKGDDIKDMAKELKISRDTLYKHLKNDVGNASDKASFKTSRKISQKSAKTGKQKTPYFWTPEKVSHHDKLTKQLGKGPEANEIIAQRLGTSLSGLHGYRKKSRIKSGTTIKYTPIPQEHIDHALKFLQKKVSRINPFNGKTMMSNPGGGSVRQELFKTFGVKHSIRQIQKHILKRPVNESYFGININIPLLTNKEPVVSKRQFDEQYITNLVERIRHLMREKDESDRDVKRGYTSDDAHAGKEIKARTDDSMVTDSMSQAQALHDVIDKAHKLLSSHSVGNELHRDHVNSILNVLDSKKKALRTERDLHQARLGDVRPAHVPVLRYALKGLGKGKDNIRSLKRDNVEVVGNGSAAPWKNRR